jgi:hypothetical protein
MKPSLGCASRRGFARADLLATMAACGLLALIQARSATTLRTASESTFCLQNLQRLARAWQQRALDTGYLVPNTDRGSVDPGLQWVPGGAGVGGIHEFNPDTLTDPTRSLLFSYLGDVSVFRCPSDPRSGPYTGTNSALIGTVVPAARSYAMNGAVGINPESETSRPTDAPWLDNNHSHKYGLRWRTYGTLDDIIDPSPTNLGVFLGEDARSINDGHFAFGMEREEWIDWMATRHNMGGCIAFADGRAEIHAWKDSRTAPPPEGVQRRIVPGSQDYQWLRSHISAPIRLARPIMIPPVAAFGQTAVRMAWPADESLTYKVEFTSDLKSWETVEATLQTGPGHAVARLPEGPSEQHRFYRMVPR